MVLKLKFWQTVYVLFHLVLFHFGKPFSTFLVTFQLMVQSKWSSHGTPSAKPMKNRRNVNDFGLPASRLGHLWVPSEKHLCDPRRPQKQTESHLKMTVGHFRSPGSFSSGFKGLLKDPWRVFWTCHGCFLQFHSSSWCCLGNFLLVQIVFSMFNRPV